MTFKHDMMAVYVINTYWNVLKEFLYPSNNLWHWLFIGSLLYENPMQTHALSKVNTRLMDFVLNLVENF